MPPKKKTNTKTKTSTKPEPKPKPKKTTKAKKATNKKTITKPKSKATVKGLTTAQAKRKVGGKFPQVSGRKYKYPAPTNEKAWTSLVNQAHNMRKRDKAALKQNKNLPVCAMRAKYEYILFHCGPRSKWKRATRNSHRRKKGLARGDPRVVHHEDQKTMSYASAVVLTKCQHKRAHGAACSR